MAFFQSKGETFKSNIFSERRYKYFCYCCPRCIFVLFALTDGNCSWLSDLLSKLCFLFLYRKGKHKKEAIRVQPPLCGNHACG